MGPIYCRVVFAPKRCRKSRDSVSFIDSIFVLHYTYSYIITLREMKLINLVEQQSFQNSKMGSFELHENLFA